VSIFRVPEEENLTLGCGWISDQRVWTASRHHRRTGKGIRIVYGHPTAESAYEAVYAEEKTS
jgi:hypothetical protein